MITFNEFGKKGKNIMARFEVILEEMAYDFGISFKSPKHDISRRFLNEINEFKQAGEVIE